MAPVTRYARSGEASIAYQVIGEGVLDLLFLTGWLTQLEQLWEAPANRRFLERLTTICRLILFDSRGTGLSDRVLDRYTVEQEVQDALAVLDAAGSERTAVLTYAHGGLVGAQLAADRPERIGALIMYASIARTSWAPDYDWAMTSEQREELSERNMAIWGEVNRDAMSAWAPSMSEDPALVAWFARLQRLAASPTEARVISRAMVELDVREALPRIRVPTLVMHRPQELV
ncbi:MAG TPA: alpha/beta hydrolase, partial [Solirubrobacteraceae bacterium]|nr:alpha/beta hydrolase [Solirubrobacteraceae bacterium]